MPKIVHTQTSTGALLVIWEWSDADAARMEVLAQDPLCSELLATVKHPSRKRELSMRILVLDDLGISLNKWEISPEGKPHLQGTSGYISVSHSGTKYAFLQHSSKACGIDIQQDDARLSQLSPKFCDREELARLGQHFPKSLELQLIWGIKESMFKAWGQGKIDFKSQLKTNLNDALQGRSYLHAESEHKSYFWEAVLLPNYTIVMVYEA